MDFFLELFGEGYELTAPQMALRTFVTFLLALVLIRISGRRSFSFHTTFDNVLTVLFGAILARAVVGASPYIPTVFSCLVLALLHRFVAWLGVYYIQFERVLKGDKIPLYKDGRFIQKNMERSLVSKEDVMEHVRIINNQNSLDGIKEIYMERTGKISLLKKP